MPIPIKLTIDNNCPNCTIRTPKCQHYWIRTLNRYLFSEWFGSLISALHHVWCFIEKTVDRSNVVIFHALETPLEKIVPRTPNSYRIPQHWLIISPFTCLFFGGKGGGEARYQKNNFLPILSICTINWWGEYPAPWNGVQWNTPNLLEFLQSPTVRV